MSCIHLLDNLDIISNINLDKVDNLVDM